MSKRKVRKDFNKSQPITVNVKGCSEDIKKQVIQAFFDVGLFWPTDDRNLSPVDVEVSSYTNLLDGALGDEEAEGYVMWSIKAKGITPKEFFDMVYEPQGHPHAEIIMQYAEDAKTHAEPWKLWQAKDKYMDNVWFNLDRDPVWHDFLIFRRKNKTHLVHGVEVPDLRVDPKRGDRYYLADPTEPEFTRNYLSTSDNCDTVWTSRRLCYENTEAGKQAAILHAKAMLGIA